MRGAIGFHAGSAGRRGDHHSALDHGGRVEKDRETMENRPIVRRVIVVALVCLFVAMAGVLFLGVALLRT